MADNRVLDSKCPNCGAVVKWNSDLNKFNCDSCGSTFELADLKKNNNAAKDENNKNNGPVIEGFKNIELERIKEGEMDSYHCGNCGASIMTTPETVATKCPYCNNTAILKEKLESGVYPTKVIPFKKKKEDAVEGFLSLAKGKLFAPKNFHSRAHIADVSAVYVPFWLYDIDVNGNITFVSNEVRHWTSGDTAYTETKTFNTVVGGSVLYSKLPVDGSTKFDDGLMDSIEPFNYDDMVDYNHAYLSGYLAEKYDVEAEEALKRAVTRVNNTTEDEFRKRVRHGGATVVANNSHYSIKNYNFVMLPVWMVNIEFDGKFYTFAMNGDTGKVVGNIPISWGRAIGFSLLFFVIVAIVVFLGAFLIGGGI